MSSVQTGRKPTTRASIKLFIDGNWCDAEAGKTLTTPNPATGETLAPRFAEADKSVTSTRGCGLQLARFFEGKWSKISARDRGRMLYKLFPTRSTKHSMRTPPPSKASGHRQANQG
jgi:hypothetical protein